ncbi:hypothetical protein [Microbacterium sp. NPDC089695]|uniref:hypothetical protein n=1 Tax=Microbacterium sp. NPDC089695 TaxID=3364198 RepID=UPI0038132EC8
MSLRALQRRLRDRGHTISIATLSQWQSGSRHPGSETAEDVLSTLEDLLGLDPHVLASAVRRTRRVPADRTLAYQDFLRPDAADFVGQSLPRDLSERSGSIMYFLDAAGQMVRTVNRTVFQARVDGARETTVYFSIEDPEIAPPAVRGTVGCELVDVRSDMDLRVVRATLRLSSPLRKGDFVLTERETRDHVHGDGATWVGAGVFAPRRQAEVGVHVIFDAERVPRACRAVVDDAGGMRSQRLVVNGTSVSHVEYDFGPGEFSVEWEW